MLWLVVVVVAVVAAVWLLAALARRGGCEGGCGCFPLWPLVAELVARPKAGRCLGRPERQAKEGRGGRLVL